MRSAMRSDRSAKNVVFTKGAAGRGVAVAIAAALTAGAHGQQPPVISYTEVAAQCGITGRHQPADSFLVGALTLAKMSGGGVVADFNNDGLEDIFFLTSGTGPDKLYINNGDGTFTDRAAQWGLTAVHMGIGASAGDYNNDGWMDIYVTSLGLSSGNVATSQHRLYRNNGNGTFTNVAVAAHVNRTTTVIPDGFGSCWGDYDLDGKLDLFVTSWVANTNGNRLFHNNGDGTFTDVTLAAGVQDSSLRGFSPRFADMNGDRYPELIVAGDFMSSHYFVNNRNGTFTNFTMGSGTGLDANGMGSTIGDYNNDGNMDWYVTSIYTLFPLPGVPGTGNMLYMGQGNDHYMEMSHPAGVNQGGWGWGTVSVDVNHDGWEDIVETNGWEQANGGGQNEWLNDPSNLFLNQHDGTFVNIGPSCAIGQHTLMGRGMAAIDYDNDGDMDIFISSYGNPGELFRSELITNGVTPSNGHWLRVFLSTPLTGARLAPNGYGAKVTAMTNGMTQTRIISPGATYLMQSEPSAHFGLGGIRVVEQLRVDWPNGRRTVLMNVPSDQKLTIRYCHADWNGDGAANSQDFFDFLTDLFASNADFNGNGVTDSQDFFDFVASFFGGC